MLMIAVTMRASPDFATRWRMNGLGLDVLAEGVETRLQRDFLIEQGCKSGQGYLFSAPLNAEDFVWMLKQRVSLPLNGADRIEHDGGEGLG